MVKTLAVLSCFLKSSVKSFSDNLGQIPKPLLLKSGFQLYMTEFWVLRAGCDSPWLVHIPKNCKTLS